MIVKTKILAKALEMGTFDVAALASHAAVPASTVYTVINRAPEEWFAQSKIATGQPGGQPTQYTVTEAGRAGIAVELGRLPIGSRMQLAPRTSDVPPLGLKVALAAVRKLPGPLSRGLSNQAVAKQLLHIRRNLDWADSELANAPATAFNAGYRMQLELARQQVAHIERARAPQVSPAKFGDVRWGTGSGAPVFEMTQPTAELAGVAILIGVLGIDDSARDLAFSARGAIRAARFTNPAVVAPPMVIEMVDTEPSGTAEKLRTLLAKHSSEPAAFPDVYLCVNSDHENNYRLTQSLDHLKPELTSYHVVILDIAESEALAGYARSENVFDYRPHAETDLSWLVGTLLRTSS